MKRQDNPRIVYWLNDSLYLNITNRCSNNCWFCFRNFKKGVGGFNLKLKKEPTAGEIKAQLDTVLGLRHWNEVVFCGFGEATERFDVLIEIVRYIRMHYSIPIRVDTNGHGYLLNKGRKVAEEMHRAGVNSVSVSLNGHDEMSYAKNCRSEFSGSFQAVISFINKAKKTGLVVEISAIRMPEVNMNEIRKIAGSIGVPLRIRDYVQCFS